MTGTVLALVTGVLLAGGVFLIAAAFLPRHPRLDDALAGLAGTPREPGLDDALPEDRWERLGETVFRRLRAPLWESQRRALQVKGRSVGDFYAEKLIWALLGLIAPPMLGWLGSTLLGLPGYAPVIAALAGGVAGFLVPDVLLLRSSRTHHSDAREALFTYFDLVVLERLANRSGPQALSAAAEISNHPVFARIRLSLDRARLEQSSPYGHLHALATELDFTELDDIADVMRLDESGAALSDVLRSRVKELRDAHLTQQKIDAQSAAERMTLPMTVPTLVFTLILFVPPLLRLAGF